MSYKILITCPPMLKQIDSFSSILSKYNFEADTPERSANHVRRGVNKNSSTL